MNAGCFILSVLCMGGAFSCAVAVDDSKKSRYEGPVNSCSSSKDCTTGSCNEELEICTVATPQDDGNWFIKVLPSKATEIPAQVFSINMYANGYVRQHDEELADDTIRINTPVEVTVQTEAENSQGGTDPLKATIVFIDEGNVLAGYMPVRTVYESNDEKDINGLKLLPGEYRVVILPKEVQSQRNLSVYLDDVVLTSEGLLKNQNDEILSLKTPYAYSKVLGEISTKGGNLQINSLEVVAIDPESGRTVSTKGTTACENELEGTECGRFTIGISSEVTEFSLKISRPAEPQHPVYVIEGFEMPEDGSDLDLKLDENNREKLYLNSLGVPVRYRAIVEKDVNPKDRGSPTYNPAPGCFVLFESDDIAGGTVERWVTTNESGELEEEEGNPGISLYPGEYSLTIVPPSVGLNSDIEYSWYTTQVVIEKPLEPEDLNGQTYRLEKKESFAGTVLANGKGVPTSILTAEPGAGSPLKIKPGSSSTGEDGSFKIWLDTYTYLIIAEAPSDSRFGWGSGSVDVGTDAKAVLSLPIPFVARGKLSMGYTSDNTTSSNLGGATIEWYRVFQGRAYMVGRTIAGNDGSFSVLLPPV